VDANPVKAQDWCVNDPRTMFGTAVRRERLRRKFSQEELADRAELDRSYIGQVERGETNISLMNLVKIADALNVGPERLVKGLSLQV